MKPARAFEVNFDGLVGPTHNYAGLSHGNVASIQHGGSDSNPRAAALQGLAKMKFLAGLGIRQAVIPPQERPDIQTLRSLGFSGSDGDVLDKVARREPRLLAAVSSASAMWVANAATVTPSSDSADGRVHFTPANLASKFHRSIEPGQTARTLRAIFADTRHFIVHDPLPSGHMLGDEGAANHTRLAPAHGARGIHLFVYGHEAFRAGRPIPSPVRFASRQAREASEAIARRHGVSEEGSVFMQQNPAAIDAGAFHNDVVAVGNENVLLYHEKAYVSADATERALRSAVRRIHPGGRMHFVRVASRAVSLHEAIRTYLFNSQLVTTSPGRMALVAPGECGESPRVRRFIGHLIESGDTPIEAMHTLDLRESMRNGGGPACLRLRVVLTEQEAASVTGSVFISDAMHGRLAAWVGRHYRERLVPRDLADPHLLEESRRALDALTRILGLGSIYPFQR